MASNPATCADVAMRWRKLSASEKTVAENLLEDAWALLKHKVPTLEARMDASEIDSALVVMVLCAMVVRRLANPDRLRQEAIQDRSMTHDVGSGSWLVDVLDDELDLLVPDDEGTGDSFSVGLAWQVPATSPAVDPAAWVWRP